MATQARKAQNREITADIHSKHLSNTVTRSAAAATATAAAAATATAAIGIGTVEAVTVDRP
jgi:alkaline phosphatase